MDGGRGTEGASGLGLCCLEALPHVQGNISSTEVLNSKRHTWELPPFSHTPGGEKKRVDSGNSINMTSAPMYISFDLVTPLLGFYLPQLNLDMGAMRV